MEIYMNKKIQEAIEKLCNDIIENAGAEENLCRAQAISILSTKENMIPDTNRPNSDKCIEKICFTNIPNPGNKFIYKGIKFTMLGIEQGGVLAVAVKPLNKEMPYDNDGSNDWRKSTLRKYLNEEHIKNFNKGDLLPFVSELTSDDGSKDYGTSEDYIFLLSCDLYRKYRPFMPKYDCWTWTITPWSCAPGSANYVRIVRYDGVLYKGFPYYTHAVATACLFNPSMFNTEVAKE